MILNCTPHPILVETGDGVRRYEPIGKAARVTTSEIPAGSLEGIPTVTLRYGAIVNLPPPRPGLTYIVSLVVLEAAAAAGRTDCVAPDTGATGGVRNQFGHLVAVRRFVRWGGNARGT